VCTFLSGLDLIGEDAFACWELFTHLVLGWPMYLIFNSTGARRTPEGKKITTVRASSPSDVKLGAFSHSSCSLSALAPLSVNHSAHEQRLPI